MKRKGELGEKGDIKIEENGGKKGDISQGNDMVRRVINIMT